MGTACVASLYINFNFILKFVFTNDNNNNNNDKFIIHLIIILCGTLFIGKLLILFMKILMRWLTILLSNDSFYNQETKRNSISSLSYNANYGSMQSLNRMILFIIPLMFILKLSVFIMLYTFIDLIQFTIAIILFCTISRCFNIIFLKIENKILEKLLKNDDDNNSNNHLFDNHLLSQYNYIHDMINYINTLFAPLIFVMFRINNIDSIHYIKTSFIQFIIQSLFDLFPLFIILIGNRSSLQSSNYHLSSNLPIDNKPCFDIPLLAINLKIQYINMMNGWTATDKCVRYYMWWSTIFISGYFTFYLLYPQQFLCAIRANIDNFIFDDFIYIQCQK